MKNNPNPLQLNYKELRIKEIATAKHLFFHNWPLKVVAIILSVILWAGLISQDPKLTRDRTFNNVSVNITGKDVMTRNGLVIVNDLNEVLQNCQITVAVPQNQYENVDTSVFNVRIDLSKIKTPGVQEVKLVATNSSTYGKVISIYPETISVDVEEFITRSRIPVSVSMAGEAPEGWYISSPTADPSLIAVSGPKSLVEAISRARVSLSPDAIIWEEGISRFAAPFMLYDRNGEVVNNPLIETTSESILIQSVVVEQNILPMKTVDVKDLNIVTGTPAEGYEITSVNFVPSQIRVAAQARVLDSIDRLFVNNTVHAEGAKADFTTRIAVNRPAEVVYMSSDSINVEVAVAPIDMDEERNETSAQ